MAAATSDASDGIREQAARNASDLARTARRDKRRPRKRLATLGRFWTKLNNDWVFNFSGTLAYGLLTSIFSILLVIIAISGFALGAISPDSRAELENGIANALPGGASGYGGEIVRAATHTLNTAAPAILVIGVLAALIGGSGLFVTVENAFGVIFRLRGRDPIRQRIVAIGMLLVFVVLVPIIMVASTVPSIVLQGLGIGTDNPLAGFVIQTCGLAVAYVAAAIFFAAIYVVVPNKPVRLGEVWRGTLVASGLLVLYELLFPFYESYFIKPGNLGSIVGFAIVIVIFFYYLAFILLVGAEIDSWAAGQRETAAPIDAILHELQAHNTTRGAAGPTAGQPQEDLQDGRGAGVMGTTHDAIEHERRDHQDDAQPPKYAESGVTGAGYRLTEQSLRIDEISGLELGTLPGGLVDNAESAPKATRPMTSRQKRTLAVLGISGAVALAGVARVAAVFMDE